MSVSSQATLQSITLRGSTKMVAEFFSYGINSILYQRGIYPPETFNRVANYDLPMMITTDTKLREFLSQVLTQVSEWLMTGEVQKLVIVIAEIDTKDVVERWAFDVDLQVDGQTPTEEISSNKTKQEIHAEIQAIFRQITATVTFLPILNKACTFDILVYTDKSSQVPSAWEESDPRHIADSSEVKLRSFSTNIHKIEPMVSYKKPSAQDV